jgi:2-methylcitrate dehydratase PrpD
VNGALAHGLDFDDQTPWGQHASSSIIPSVFALAERTGGVAGRDVLAAVAAGQDLFARLRCNVGWLKDWNLSSVLGVYAATAASARALGLHEHQVHHALGIASQRSAGIMEVVAGTGSDLRGMYAGFAAEGAVVAVELAARGITGVGQLFEGPYGVFSTYFRGVYDREGMLQGIGEEYRGGTTLYKKWPAVGTSHSHIHATIQLMLQHGIRPEDIAELRVFVGDYHALMCRPLAERQAPATLVDAKFSLPFLVAVAAVRGDVGVADFSDTGLLDPRVRMLAARVVPVEDSSLDWRLELPPGRVEIVTVDGRRFEATGDAVPGSLESPMTWAEVAEKFRGCAMAAQLAPAPWRIETAIEMVRTLEHATDAAELMAVLTGTDDQG